MLVLAILAAIPRFHNLDDHSLYSDETLTYLAATQMRDTGQAALPSGMPYSRAYPFTWVSSKAVESCSTIGCEFELRSVPASFGSIAPAVLYLTVAATTSHPVGFVAGSLLALSEWHISYSRFARMYSPFLVFFVLTFFLFTRLASGSNSKMILFASFFCFLATVSLHLLGFFAVLPLLLIPLTKRRSLTGKDLWMLSTGATLFLATLLLNELLIESTYSAWVSNEIETKGSARSLELPILRVFGAILGFIISIFWVSPIYRKILRTPSIPINYIYAGSLCAVGTLAGSGHFYAAGLVALALTCIARRSTITLFFRNPWLLLAYGAIIAAWVFVTLFAEAGYSIRSLLTFPFPYFVLLFQQFALVVVLFLLALLTYALILRPRSTALECAFILVLGTCAAIGLAQEWGGTRYLLHTYPALLFTVAYLVVNLFQYLCSSLTNHPRFSRTAIVPTCLVLAVILIGGVPGHGAFAAFNAANIKSKDKLNELLYIFDNRPDHRGSGAFLQRHLNPTDIVIAEDTQAQHIYSGRVDYWFRGENDAQNFVFRDETGQLRDIYIGAQLITEPSSLRKLIEETTGKIWLITSAETASKRGYYLNSNQYRFLNTLEEQITPQFVGADGISAVYCLSCIENRKILF